MIIAIRIRGDVGLKIPQRETLNRLRLRRKYSAIVLDKPGKEQLGMIEKSRNFLAYGEIDEATYKKLVEARGQKGKDEKLKPFFRLHPPRGGIDSKKHFGIKKGVLGNHGDKIKELLERML